MSILTLSTISGCTRGSHEFGELEIAHPSPIFQDITRIAFVESFSKGNGLIHFSTLESYSRNPDGDRLLLSAYDPVSGHLKSQTVKDAPEIRSYAFSRNLNRYVLGASLDPKIYLYDTETFSLAPIFRGPNSNAFIHRLAVKGDYVYTILSTPKPTIRGFNGILKVNLKTGKYQVIPFRTHMEQGWGGVQTIDPTGRIWFYRGYPLRMMWYDLSLGMRERSVRGYENWVLESWDIWGGETYLVLSNRRGEFIKRRVDLSKLVVLDENTDLESKDFKIFLESVRIDLYHNGVSSDPLYFDPKNSKFFIRNAEEDLFTFIGRADLGQFEVMGTHGAPQESATRWIHPQLGELEVLGRSPTGDGLLVWLRGRKTYAILDFESGKLVQHNIGLTNLSPADITSLVIGNDGSLYGGGILTFSHLFKYNALTGESLLLKGAIPNAEGQINSMFKGLDGKIYGAGYPDSVLFMFDPSAPWNPGNKRESNPTNLGPMGHYRQTRAWNGVQDLDGNIWYQSVTDYDYPIAHALAKADFINRKLEVKTDLDDGFPKVYDLAVFDSEHLILYGENKGTPGLYILNQKDFNIEKEKKLNKAGGVLANLDPHDHSTSQLLFAQGRMLYRVNSDLSFQFVHRSKDEILKILAGDEGDIVLIGKAHIENINLKSGISKIWWNKGDKAGRYLFKHLSWRPVVFHAGVVYFADEEKLWKLYPPRS